MRDYLVPALDYDGFSDGRRQYGICIEAPRDSQDLRWVYIAVPIAFFHGEELNH